MFMLYCRRAAGRLNSGVMRLSIIFLCVVISGALIGCASTGSAPSKDPADLTAPGKTIRQLNQDDWTISDPITVAQVEASALEDIRNDAERFPHMNIPLVPFGFVNSEWISFKSKIRQGDEVRRIRNARAGIGLAIFRDGHLAEMFLPVMF